MLRQALSFPASGKEGGKTFVLGGLSVFGFLVGYALATGAFSHIVEMVADGRPVDSTYYWLAGGGAMVGFFCYLLLAGFAPRVLEATARGRTTVPAFGTVPSLLGDGGRVLAVKAGYLLPGVGLIVLSRVLASAPLSGTVRTVSRSAAALLLLLFLLYMFALFYAVPAAVTLFGLEGSVRAAFDLGRLRRVVISEDYAVGWVIGVVVLSVGGFVSLLLTSVLVGFFAFFHVNAAARYCYGIGVGRALEVRPAGGGEPESGALPTGDPMAPEIRRRYK